MAKASWVSWIHGGNIRSVSWRRKALEITPIGWLLAPLALGFYFLKPSRLYSCMVFFLPFSATAVVNIGSGVSASGVQATMLFGVLWMAKELPRLWRVSSTDGEAHLKKPSRQLLLFLFAVVLSLVMPLMINGRVTVDLPEFANPESTAVRFTLRNITQTGYIIYGVLLTICVAGQTSKAQEFVKSVRIFVVSAIFVSLWGLFQFVCYWVGIAYPAYIFNTSATESALGYLQELEDIGMTRISSVATEPSILAQFLLVAAVFVLFALVSDQPIISKTWDRCALVVTVGVLLLSTSTIAYIGLGVTLVLYILALWHWRILRRRHAVLLIAFAAFLGLVYAAYSPVQDLVDLMLLGKGESSSGIGRMLSVLQASDYFLQYPILGLGWGSLASHDLIFKLLSNTGILGFSSFSLFVFTVLARLWQRARSGKARDLTQSWHSACLLVALLVLLFANMTTGFVYPYGHAWFVFGLAMSVPSLYPLTERVAYPTQLQPSPAALP